MSRIFLVLVSVVGFGQVAWGQAPVVVENHLVTEMPNFQFPTGPFDYMDFPQSKRTITVPAARASIVWSVTMASNQQPTRVRPVIGPNFPEDGIQNLESTNDGNWAASVEGGTIDVGLQVRSLNDPGAGFTLNPSNSLSHNGRA